MTLDFNSPRRLLIVLGGEDAKLYSSSHAGMLGADAEAATTDSCFHVDDSIVDVYTRESVAIEAGQSLKGEDVVRVLNRAKQQRGVPKFLFCDNGSEFTSQAMDLWAYQNGMKIDFSRPGKPTDNAFIESFNGTFRAECLNAHWFGTRAEAKRLIEAWRQEYNESRPHRSLGERTPGEFASQYAASRVLTAT
jgi:putative transposase